jgi:hypothetical protein
MQLALTKSTSFRFDSGTRMLDHAKGSLRLRHGISCFRLPCSFWTVRGVAAARSSSLEHETVVVLPSGQTGTSVTGRRFNRERPTAPPGTPVQRVIEPYDLYVRAKGRSPLPPQTSAVIDRSPELTYRLVVDPALHRAEKQRCRGTL